MARRTIRFHESVRNSVDPIEDQWLLILDDLTGGLLVEHRWWTTQRVSLPPDTGVDWHTVDEYRSIEKDPAVLAKLDAAVLELAP